MYFQFVFNRMYMIISMQIFLLLFLKWFTVNAFTIKEIVTHYNIYAIPLNPFRVISGKLLPCNNTNVIKTSVFLGTAI